MKDTSRKYTENADGTITLGYGPTLKRSSYQTIRDYRTAYVKSNYRCFNIKINKTKHQDVIDRMEAQDNLVEYIVGLVRADMIAEASKK